jgi:hypothetical protein
MMQYERKKFYIYTCTLKYTNTGPSNILILIKSTRYKIYLRDRLLVPNISMSLQTTPEAEAHLAEQILLEEQRLNIETSLIHRARARRPTVSETEG